jgi:hypothetical protein
MTRRATRVFLRCSKQKPDVVLLIHGDTPSALNSALAVGLPPPPDAASNSRARSLSDVGSGLKIQCSRVFAVASAQTAQTYKGSITTDMIGLPTFRLLVPP